MVWGLQPLDQAVVKSAKQTPPNGLPLTTSILRAPHFCLWVPCWYLVRLWCSSSFWMQWAWSVVIPLQSFIFHTLNTS